MKYVSAPTAQTVPKAIKRGHAHALRYGPAGMYCAENGREKVRFFVEIVRFFVVKVRFFVVKVRFFVEGTHEKRLY